MDLLSHPQKKEKKMFLVQCKLADHSSLDAVCSSKQATVTVISIYLSVLYLEFLFWIYRKTEVD